MQCHILLRKYNPSLNLVAGSFFALSVLVLLGLVALGLVPFVAASFHHGKVPLIPNHTARLWH